MWLAPRVAVPWQGYGVLPEMRRAFQQDPGAVPNGLLLPRQLRRVLCAGWRQQSGPDSRTENRRQLQIQPMQLRALDQPPDEPEPAPTKSAG
jgi:hypothetical protein